MYYGYMYQKKLRIKLHEKKRIINGGITFRTSQKTIYIIPKININLHQKRRKKKKNKKDTKTPKEASRKRLPSTAK